MFFSEGFQSARGGITQPWPGPQKQQTSDQQKWQGGIAQRAQQRVALLRRVDLDLDPEIRAP